MPCNAVVYQTAQVSAEIGQLLSLATPEVVRVMTEAGIDLTKTPFGCYVKTDSVSFFLAPDGQMVLYEGTFLTAQKTAKNTANLVRILALAQIVGTNAKVTSQTITTTGMMLEVEL